MGEDNHGDRLTRLEVQFDGMREDIKRIEEAHRSGFGRIMWIGGLIVAYFVNSVLGLFKFGGPPQ